MRGLGGSNEAVGQVVELGEATSGFPRLVESRKVEVLADYELEEGPWEPFFVHHDRVGGPRFDDARDRETERVEVPLEPNLEPHSLGIAIAPVPPDRERTPARVDDTQVVVAGARAECPDEPRLVERVAGEHRG